DGLVARAVEVFRFLTSLDAAGRVMHMNPTPKTPKFEIEEWEKARDALFAAWLEITDKKKIREAIELWRQPDYRVEGADDFFRYYRMVLSDSEDLAVSDALAKLRDEAKIWRTNFPGLDLETVVGAGD